MRHVAGAGVSIAVRERGDAGRPTVVLVHGFPDTSGLWSPVAERLGDRFHVVAYDVRGAGASDRPTSTNEYRLALLLDDLTAVLDATAGGGGVHLVGHDWGSIQAWGAVRHPPLAGRITTMTSISGPPLDHAGRWMRRQLHPTGLPRLASQLARSSYVAGFQLPGLPRLLGAVRRRVDFAALFTGALRPDERRQVDDEWPAPTIGDDVAHGVRLYRANVFASVRGRDPSPTASVPVQLVVPTEDRYVRPSLVEGLPYQRRHELAAGHWVVRSHPDEVAARIADFADAHR